MNKPAPNPRLHILTAREAPVAVVIRRGPSKRFHIVKINTVTNEIEHGSWFQGTLYPMRCDLSPDGEYMAYLAMGRTGDTWNGVCRPPFLRCEATWPNMGTWNGGGIWTDHRTLAVNLAGSLWHRRKLKKSKLITGPNTAEFRFDLHDAVMGEDETVLYPRLSRDGWERQGGFGTETVVENDAGWLVQPQAGIPSVRLFFRGYEPARGRVFEFVMDDHADFFSGSEDWVSIDAAGHLLVARSGRFEKWTAGSFRDQRPAWVFDLTDLKPPQRTEQSESGENVSL